jgi:hypothetical protein
VRIFAYFGVCNGFVTKTKHDLTRPQNSCKTWRSRKSGNQKTTRGNTMGELIIMGFGDSKKIDLTAKTTEDVMKEIQGSLKDMAKAENDKGDN